MTNKNKWMRTALCGMAAIGLTLGTANLAFAQKHTGGGDTHTSGHETDASHGGGNGQQRKGGGTNAGQRGGGGHGDLRDVFEQMEAEGQAEGINEHGAGGKGQAGRPATETGKGRPAGKGSSSATKGSGHSTTAGEESEEDSDRPDYAGPGGRDNKPGRPNQESGVKKGGIYGDMYVIVRDANGVPILDENGYVQVKYLDADGNLQCCIPRDAEGNLLTTLADGTPVLPLEVELGRLSVGRSPTQVLAAQYDEAITTINSATSVALDASGRIVVTLADGTEKTIELAARKPRALLRAADYGDAQRRRRDEAR